MPGPMTLPARWIAAGALGLALLLSGCTGAPEPPAPPASQATALPDEPATEVAPAEDFDCDRFAMFYSQGGFAQGSGIRPVDPGELPAGSALTMLLPEPVCLALDADVSPFYAPYGVWADYFGLFEGTSDEVIATLEQAGYVFAPTSPVIPSNVGKAYVPPGYDPAAPSTVGDHIVAVDTSAQFYDGYTPVFYWVYVEDAS